jgi:hypothetical protein
MSLIVENGANISVRVGNNVTIKPDLGGNVITQTAEWGDITGTLSDQTDLQTALNLKVNTSSLATVATTGNYNDLLNKPTIPTNAVDSVNGQTGVVVLDQDDILDGVTFKQYSQTEKSKLAGIATGATANQTDSYLLDRANHTGTQLASTISDFQTTVSANTDVTANTAHRNIVTGNPHNVSYSDLDDPETDVTFAMANKTVTWNFTNPNGGLLYNVTGNAAGHFFEILQTGGNPSSDMHLIHLEASDSDVLTCHLVPASATSRALKINIPGENMGVGRMVINASGRIDWGDGTNPLDTNLYRASANTLRTDDNLIVAEPTLSTHATTKNYVDNKANEKEYKKTLVVGSSNADYITDGTDDQVQIQQAIDALTAGRTWSEKVVIKGNINVGAKINVPSYTTIEVLGTVTVNNSWTPATANFVGIFDVTNGDTTQVTDVIIRGGRMVGTAFSSYPTFTGGNREVICGIHSIRSIKDSYFGDFISENLGSPITLEKLGAINGNKSRNITYNNIIIDKAFVGVQTYSNGYIYDTLNVTNITFKDVVDDVVAICGNAAGIVGATGEFSNVNIDNVTGAKNGTTGAVIKIDAGSTTVGKGIFRDVNISNVTSSTTGSNESLVALFQGDNVLSRNVQGSNIVGEGTFLRGFWIQSAFRGVIFSNFVTEATHNIQLQSTALPSDSQSVKFVDGVCKSPTSTVVGDGIVYSAGTALQGVRNVKLYNVDFENKSRPINEGSTIPSGTGIQGTYNNIYYDVDLRDRTTADCVFTATNSLKRIYRNGLFISDDLDVQNVKLTGDQTIAGVKTLSSIPVLPSSNPTTSNQAVRKGYIDDALTDTATLIRQYNIRATTAGVAPTAYNKSVLNRHLDDNTIWSRQQPNYFLNAKSSAFSALTSSLIASGTNNLNSAFTGSTGSYATMTITDTTAGFVFDQPATATGTHGIDTGYSPNGFNTGFTVSLWFKPSTVAGVRRLVAWNTSAEARIDFLMNGTTLIGRACQTSATYIGRQRTVIMDTTWQKLTVTYDGTGLSSGVKLYRNGVAVDNADSNAGTFTGIPATSTDNIPLLSYANNTQANPATGQADVIEIISGVARTANEELQLFNLQKGRFGI